MLHVGTHFMLRPGEIGRSWMQLGDGRRLALNELLSWRIVSQELVTLSACQTGVGGGSEVEGLATLLLKRGAGAVVASLVFKVTGRDPHVLAVVFCSIVGAVGSTYLQRYFLIVGTGFGGAWTLIVGAMAAVGNRAGRAAGGAAGSVWVP